MKNRYDAMSKDDLILEIGQLKETLGSAAFFLYRARIKPSSVTRETYWAGNVDNLIKKIKKQVS